jgi:hypothetical protein
MKNKNTSKKKLIFILFSVTLVLLLVVLGYLLIYYYQNTQTNERANSLDTAIVYKTNNDYSNNVLLQYEPVNNNLLLHIPEPKLSDTIKLSDGYYFNTGIFSENYMFLDMTYDEYILFLENLFPEYTSKDINQFFLYGNWSNEDYQIIRNEISQRILDENPFTEMYVCKDIAKKIYSGEFDNFQNFVNNCLIEKDNNLDLEKYYSFLDSLSEKYGYDVIRYTAVEISDVEEYPHLLDEEYLLYTSYYRDCIDQYKLYSPSLRDSVVYVLNQFIEQGLLEERCEKIK